MLRRFAQSSPPKERSDDSAYHVLLREHGANSMTVRRLTNSFAVLVAVAMLAACGGGGATSPSAHSPGQPPVTAPQSTQSLALTFAGTQTLGKVRSPRD